MVLHERLAAEGWRLLLASASPRRRDLMGECGLSFELMRYSVEECYPDTTPAAEVPLYLSRIKSEGCPTPLGDRDLLITADTVVLLEDEILGKPDGMQGAREMLHRLSGQCHTVITGVTLRSGEKCESFSAESRVWFRELSEEEIDYYVERFKPLDKAGSYGIQEWIGFIGIERIDGSFYNVMGLPLQRLYCELERFIS